ncbi:MAG TPA: hypothetical protein VJM50_21040 [Pyrinomonadaceae bacterium]|nr:hypothetical protein [Pyrinomonadaceae bacterium]
MIVTKKHKSLSLILFALLAWTGAASGQQTNGQQTTNYAFVSPNTRENLKIEDAIKGMNSAEGSQLQMKAINLGCVVKSKIRTYRALGAWSDGAEHSILLRVQSDPAALRYLMSRLGRDAQQKYVIYFYPQPGGPDDLYTLQVPTRDLVALSNALEQAGIPFRTLVPGGKTTAVYIIDLNRELRDKIFAAARKLSARVSYQTGDADLFGDDIRENARVKFEREIKDYEAKNLNLPPACDVQKAQRKTH